MKKLICILLALTFILMIGSVSFAAKGGTTITDPNTPGSPARTVDSETYGVQQVEILDNDIPAGGAGGTGTKDTASGQNADIKDQTVPKGNALPRTGGIPAETFYATGALLVVAAIILLRKTAKN